MLTLKRRTITNFKLRDRDASGEKCKIKITGQQFYPLVEIALFEMKTCSLSALSLF